MRPLTRVLAVLCLLFGTGLGTLSSLPPAQAVPAPSGPGAVRLRMVLQEALQQLILARAFLTRGNTTAMNAAIGRSVADLERASVLLAGTEPGPLSETVAALLADFTATDLAEDPELAALLLERAGAELEALLAADKVVPQSGRAGRLALNPPAAEFGILCPGEERTMEIQITNKSTTARRLRLAATAADGFEFTEESPDEVAAGATVTVTLHFKAPDTVGRFRKAVMLHAEADGQRDIGLFLNVTATTRLVLIDPYPLDFDEVVIGETKSMNVTVRNCTGQQIRGFVRFTAQTDKAFGFGAGQAQELTLPAGGSVPVTLTFTPQHTTEVKGPMQFFIPSSRRLGDVLGSVNMVGRGKEQVKVGARTLNFGTVAAGQFHTRTVTIENNTGLPQEVTVDRSKLHAEYWSVSPVGALKLPANSVTQVSLRFGAIGRCQHRGTLIVKGPKIARGKGNVAVSVLSR